MSAPHTDEYLQDLCARYIGVNEILLRRGAQAAFEDLTWDQVKINHSLSEVRSNLGQLLEQSDQSDISTIGQVSTWERILAAEETNNHEHAASAEGVPEMMADAMRCLNQPLTKQRLCDWHYRLYYYDVTKICKFPIGEYRGIEEGPLFFQDSGFVCVEAEKIEEEMDKFLSWFNEDRQIDPLLRAAVAPLWFLTIHPFGNGNGRLSRAIAEMSLAEVNPRIQNSCSIAKELMLERDDYYRALGKTQTGATSDITEYLCWFLGCLDRAIRSENARPKS